MAKLSRIFSWVVVAAVTATTWSCANIGRPSGGEKDSKGPEVFGAVPFPGTLNFSSDEVVFYFDEFLKPGNYRKEVFISPVPAVDPEITVKNKMLRIKFQAPLRDSTTYVITLGTGILDFNEGNKMSRAYTYAVSTGSVLDSLKFSGNVNDMWTGTGEKDMKVMLFPANDLEGNAILGKRPDYVTVTDEEGRFDFQFLAAGDYKIFAVADVNNDFEYSGSTEKLGLTENPLVMLRAEDSIPLRVSMVSFYQDNEGPKVKSVKWANDFTVHVEFAEPIRPTYLQDSLAVMVSDTNGAGLLPVENSRFRHQDLRHLYLHSPIARNKDLNVKFVNLMDSIGQKRDTIVRLTMQSSVKEEKGKWFEKPVNLPRGQEFVIASYFKLPASIDTSMFRLVDTGGVVVPTEIQIGGFQMILKPTEKLNPDLKYSLQFLKPFPTPDGNPLDTLIKMRIRFPKPDDFGTISGRVLPDSTRPDLKFATIFRGGAGSARLVDQNDTEGGKTQGGMKGGGAAGATADVYEQRFVSPGAFKFIFLKPGKYSIDLIEDTDGNGILTPGSLDPYRLPEKVYHQTGTIEIRAKWDLKDVEVYPIPAAGGKGKLDSKVGGKKGIGTEDGDPSNADPKGEK
jgi:uncharacterized protein (DUF2141 family)